MISAINSKLLILFVVGLVLSGFTSTHNQNKTEGEVIARTPRNVSPESTSGAIDALNRFLTSYVSNNPKAPSKPLDRCNTRGGIDFPTDPRSGYTVDRISYTVLDFRTYYSEDNYGVGAERARATVRITHKTSIDRESKPATTDFILRLDKENTGWCLVGFTKKST